MTIDDLIRIQLRHRHGCAFGSILFAFFFAYCSFHLLHFTNTKLVTNNCDVIDVWHHLNIFPPVTYLHLGPIRVVITLSKAIVRFVKVCTSSKGNFNCPIILIYCLIFAQLLSFPSS